MKHLALPWYLRVSTELLSCFIGAKVQAESYTGSLLKVGKCRLNGLGDNLSARLRVATTCSLHFVHLLVFLIRIVTLIHRKHLLFVRRNQLGSSVGLGY